MKSEYDSSMEVLGNPFPRTTVGGRSVSRMIVGTNWFLGFSHCTPSKDKLIHDTFGDYGKMADVLEVFFRAGVDTMMGLIQNEKMRNAVREVEQRTGRKAIVVSTPGFPTNPLTPVHGFDMDQVNRILDKELEYGADILLPHTGTTDVMLDLCARRIRKMDQILAGIRERGMIPGLSTHRPESIIYADENEMDVETYISIFNSLGFLMPVEVDWTATVIRDARKPVMTIKSMAAGQLRPFQALTFSWNAIRPQDMVTVGTMTPDEAREVVEISLGILEHRKAEVQLQETRSKVTVRPLVKEGTS